MKRIKENNGKFMEEVDKAIENTELRCFLSTIILHMIDYREENNLDLPQFAELLGVTPEYLNKFMRGQNYENVTLGEILGYLHVIGMKLVITENE